MKILLSRLSWQRKTPGGAELSAFQHTKTMRSLDNEVTLISNVRIDGIKYLYLPLPSQRHLQFFAAVFMLPFYAFKNYDIINAHSRTDQIIFTLLKPLHKKPVVWKDAGDLTHQIKTTRTGVYENLNQKLLIAALKRADAIYTLNNDDKVVIEKKLKALNQHVEPSLIRVIPSDILFSDYKLDVKSIARPKKIIIGVVGRLEIHSKGYDTLIKALTGIDSKLYELWIVGGGADRKKLEELTKEIPVKFFGYQINLSKYYNSFNIFVQPSRFEGFGRTVKEAMYFGLPVIGSDTGGIKVQIKHEVTGLLVPPNDPGALRKSIKRLLKDPSLRKNLGEKAHKKVMLEGDMETLINKSVLPLFQAVLKNYTRNGTR